MDKQPWPDWIPRDRELLASMTRDQLPPVKSLVPSVKRRILEKIKLRKELLRKQLAGVAESKIMKTYFWACTDITSDNAESALEYGLNYFQEAHEPELFASMIAITGGKEKARVLNPVNLQVFEDIADRHLAKYEPMGSPIWIVPLKGTNGSILRYQVLAKFMHPQMISHNDKFPYGELEALKEVIQEDFDADTALKHATTAFPIEINQKIRCSVCGSHSFHCGCDE